MSITRKDRARAKSVMAQFEIDEARRRQNREAHDALMREAELHPKTIAYLQSAEGKADIKAFVAAKLDRLYKFLGVDK